MQSALYAFDARRAAGARFGQMSLQCHSQPEAAVQEGTVKTKRDSGNGAFSKNWVGGAPGTPGPWSLTPGHLRVLYLTMFSKNMTTVISFTTGTDSQLADDLFVERFPQAGYDQESHL